MKNNSFFDYVIKFLYSKVAIVFVILFLIGWALIEVLVAYKFISEQLLSRLSLVGGMLGTALLFLFTEWKGHNAEDIEIDKNNFKKFLQMLPPSGAISVFENHWFQSNFPSKIFSEIDTVNSFYSQPGRDFLDAEINSDVKKFLDNMNDTVGKITGYTSFVDADTAGFPVELKMYDRGLYEKRADKLNTLTKITAKQYRTLVDKWSKKLKISH